MPSYEGIIILWSLESTDMFLSFVGRMEHNKRVLSIQSHVVSGYVGNKSACFPLQVLGLEVDAINSVQLSNHTGYKHCRGQVLNAENLTDLFDGLRLNSLLNHSHILTGYVGSATFLRSVAEIVKDMKENNGNIIFVCDPVMGDAGKMYVPEELLPIYRDSVIIHSDILTPNQFEAELLTSMKIKDQEGAFEAINKLHSLGIPTVVITSTNLGDDKTLLGFASSTLEPRIRLKLHMPLFPASFTGTGDLFTALLLAWMTKTDNNLKESCEKTINTMHAVLKRTFQQGTSTSFSENTPSVRKLELKLIQSINDITDPKIVSETNVENA